jgi:hypothetical protein
MKQAVLTSLSRAGINNPDQVFAGKNYNESEKQKLQNAYWKFKYDNYNKITPVLIRPYRKSDGNPVFSYRESNQAINYFRDEPEKFRKKYRLIAKMQQADKYISKALNYYLCRVLEGKFISAGDNSPYLSERCYSYRKTRGVHDALTYLEECAYDGDLKFIARTDIKSYFDVIDRGILEEQLYRLFATQKVSNSVSVISWLIALAGAEKKLEWKVCRGGGDSRSSIYTSNIPVDNVLGIPQGNPISAPLSNLYLSDTDFEMVNHGLDNGYRYLRYADDIIICAKTKNIAVAALDKLRTSISELNLELGEDKTSIDNIYSGNISFLGFHYLEDVKGKEIASDKVKKFKDKIRHLTSRQHSVGRDIDITRLIYDINIRILVTRNQTNVNNEPARLSPHSFCVHYGHNNEDAVFRQMGQLDSYIRWRVSRALTDPSILNSNCHREFFNRILPEHNRKLVKAGERAINLIPLTGVFRNIPKIRSAGSYGLDN